MYVYMLLAAVTNGFCTVNQNNYILSLSLSLLFLRGHKGTIWSLATYGDRLFSSSSDGTIKVWDIADLRRGCLTTITSHKAVSHCYIILLQILPTLSLPPSLPLSLSLSLSFA